MKLAEALSIRADSQKRIAQLRERLKNSSKVQEGDVPVEKAEELFKELDSSLVELENLIKYICTIDAAELRRKVDSYSRQLRELDLKIQSLNWAVELE
jgi:hypothetical protein